MKRLIYGLIKTILGIYLYSIDSVCLIIKRRKKSTDKIITIVRLDAIGDFVIYISSNNLIPRKYKDFRKVLICNELVLGLAESLGIFDYIIPVNLNKFKTNLIYRINILKKVSSINTHIILQPTFSRGFATGDTIVRFSNANLRIAFNGDLVNQSRFFRLISDRWYSNLIEPESSIKMELERNHEFIEKVSKEKISFKKFKLAKLSDLTFLNKSNKYIIISPGASSKYRCWPYTRFRKLIKLILEKYKFNIIICGTRSEELLINQIINNINSKLISKSLDQTLIEYIEMIRNAEFLIGNDSSSIHIANFVNTKSICLYGGNLPGRFLPYPKGLNNRPLIASNLKCKNQNWDCSAFHNCLHQINVEDVINLVENVC